MKTLKHNRIREDARQRQGLLRRRQRLESLEQRHLLSADLLFADSFEVGQWNGNWVEDSQNAWFRSTQRATDGSYNVPSIGTLGGNQPPVAYAGEDQILNDAGGNGDEFVTLVGSGTDSDGTIVAYEWSDGTTVLGTEARIATTLPLGTHTLTLTVTDNDGATGTDTVTITIHEDIKKPVKVFFLAGHSNMLGTAGVENLEPEWNVPQDTWIWLDHNMDGVGHWMTVGPGHGFSTHVPFPDQPEGLDPRNGLGPELSISSMLADAYPGYRIALIKHGRGGGDVASHFNPDNIGPPESREHMWSGLLKKSYDAFAVLDASGYTYEAEGVFLALAGIFR
jgi:hypothetical protein